MFCRRIVVLKAHGLPSMGQTLKRRILRVIHCLKF